MNEQGMRYQKAKGRVTALRGFYRHLSVYVIVNLGLFLLNITTSPDRLWFFWPLMGWGIGLVLNAVQVFVGSSGSNWEQRKINKFMNEG
jgi:hypothetical protein